VYWDFRQLRLWTPRIRSYGFGISKAR
jgi:hypothetical protein